jgi:hypothetical protein
MILGLSNHVTTCFTRKFTQVRQYLPTNMFFWRFGQYVSVYNLQKCVKIFFCSTRLEFENFLLCKRILINVTACQNETSS